jgi:hypothetical protein
VDFGEIVRILASFEREGLDYAIFGGVALNFHGIVRATEDLDVFVRPDPENIARLRRALWSVYDDPNIDEISTEDLLGEYPAVRYYPPSSGEEDELYLDILTRLGEFASFDRLEIEELEVDGVRVKLVSPRTLYWLKQGTVRDIDRADAAFLKDKFGLEQEGTTKDGGT